MIILQISKYFREIYIFLIIRPPPKLLSTLDAALLGLEWGLVEELCLKLQEAFSLGFQRAQQLDSPSNGFLWVLGFHCCSANKCNGTTKLEYV